MPIRSLKVALDFGDRTIHVGQLAVTATHYAFQFDEGFLENPLPISPYVLTPLRRVVQRPQLSGLWGVFEDSLPDSFGRRVLARRMKKLGIEGPTALDMLSVVGTRTMGALIYAPSSDHDSHTTPVALGLLAQDTEELYRDSPAKVLDALVAAAGTAGGARPKVVVGRTKDGKLWPDGGALPSDATRWLIKFHGDDSVHSGVIEHALTRLAAEAGIEVPASEILVAEGGKRYFAVERFDRPNERRLHLHTFGGLAMRSAFEPGEYSELLGVAHQLTKSLKAAEDAFRRMVFNVAVGNRDDHEKNFAFLMTADGNWRLSPAYDLTWSSPKVKPEHTMLVGSKGRGITGNHCREVAQSAGIPRSRADDIINEVVSAVAMFPDHAVRAKLPENMIDQINIDISANVSQLSEG
jgi:serine/threonine-protein kinase HipA